MKPTMLVLGAPRVSDISIDVVANVAFHILHAGTIAEAVGVLEAAGEVQALIAELRVAGSFNLSEIREVHRHIPSAGLVLVTDVAKREEAEAACGQGVAQAVVDMRDEAVAVLKAAEAAQAHHADLQREAEALEESLGAQGASLIRMLLEKEPELSAPLARLQDHVKGLCRRLRPFRPWQVRAAGVMLWIGYLPVSDDVVSKVAEGEELSDREWHSFRAHPEHARALLEKAPHMGVLAELVHDALAEGPMPDDPDQKLARLILRVASDAAWLMERLETRSAALILQAREEKHRDPVEEQVTLEMVDLMLAPGEERPDSVRRLERNTGLLLPGDTLAEDLKTRGGSLLLSRGQILNGKLIRQLKDFAKQREIDGPITIARESE